MHIMFKLMELLIHKHLEVYLLSLIFIRSLICASFIQFLVNDIIIIHLLINFRNFDKDVYVFLVRVMGVTLDPYFSGSCLHLLHRVTPFYVFYTCNPPPPLAPWLIGSV